MLFYSLQAIGERLPSELLLRELGDHRMALSAVDLRILCQRDESH